MEPLNLFLQKVVALAELGLNQIQLRDAQWEELLAAVSRSRVQALELVNCGIGVE
eukprot:CAMPEP_0204382824 /NCGR_PEP_ID=MMETSP0469-20131031/55454_1 /ASSEMBLY_ACC=CAM_ASM_000384 /TAXON_ID=2969 /ORGANISM="Oxyrrhis marina" /LENGTH=54 /DNA_ID=CAMNT_0051375003 /DNA_START=6 /DNA_END=167 /DNA_ORIENTATION=+